MGTEKTKAATYRPLSPAETRQLEQQGCTAEDWKRVEVAPDIDLRHVTHVHFSGSNRIGAFRKTITLPGGVACHTGIRHATLHDTTVGDDCLIEHIHGYIAHYDIGTGCVLLRTDTLAMTGPSAFGNGTELSVMSESGGREIVMHDRLSAQEAYLQAMYRHDGAFIRNLRKLALDYAARQTSTRGTVGNGTQIVRCGVIYNVRIGACSRLEGATRLENGTINSLADAPTVVGEGVIARDFILQSGCHVTDGAMLTRCHVGQASVIGHGFSATDAYFACNCQAEHGEACAIWAGPYTVTHHKSTLLIGGMFSFMNAGSGTNQSNHAYKLGPRHHGVLERGCKTASGSHIAWPARVGAFSLVMGHCLPGTDSSEWPFAYLVEQGAAHYVIPGITLRGVGTLRDIGKWPARDGRSPEVPWLDEVSYEAFSPYTMGRVWQAVQTLEGLAGRYSEEVREVERNGLRLKGKAVRQGLEWYRLALDRYLGEQLLAQLEAHEDIPADKLYEALRPAAPYCGRWGDIGGMLAPMDEIHALEREVATGQLARTEDLAPRFRRIHGQYAAFAWAWTWHLLHEIYPDAHGDGFVEKLCLPVLRAWADAATELNRQIIADAQKDILPSPLAGFGIDGDEETALADARAVRGTVEGCSIIQDLGTQQEEIRKKSTYWRQKFS